MHFFFFFAFGKLFFYGSVNSNMCYQINIYDTSIHFGINSLLTELEIPKSLIFNIFNITFDRIQGIWAKEKKQ